MDWLGHDSDSDSDEEKLTITVDRIVVGFGGDGGEKHTILFKKKYNLE